MLEKASVFSMEEASAFWFSKPGSGSFLSLLLLQLPVRLGVDVALGGVTGDEQFVIFVDGGNVTGWLLRTNVGSLLLLSTLAFGLSSSSASLTVPLEQKGVEYKTPIVIF
jgi:hypothetical protein